MTSKQRICLNMIVKDEADVIRRSLQALRPLVDSWVIVDTGSSDETCNIIREVMAGVPGVVHHRPWKNFGHNRSEAIALARDHGDYLLFFDADDMLLTAPGYKFPELHADAYTATYVTGDTRYQRITLVATRLPWRYEGVIHAYATPDQKHSLERLDGFVVESRRDGARGQLDPVQKYLRNADLLSRALREDPRNARYAFYLAMSLRDAGRAEQAIDAFQHRISLGGWDEEVWFSKLQIAALREKLGRPDDTVIASYLAAHEYRPIRAEALGMLARYLRLHGKRWELARIFATRAIQIPLPADTLFLDTSWYSWRALDEFALASYWSGDHAAAARANTQLLESGALPEAHRARVKENLEFCRKKLGVSARDAVTADTGEMPVWMDAVEREQVLGTLRSLAPRRMLEWGAGGSTRLFLEALPSLKELVSIEHDRQWHAAVAKAIDDPRLQLHFVPPDSPAPPGSIRDPEVQSWAKRAEFEPSLMRSYVQRARDVGGPFDAVFVDGRARRFCISAGFELLRPGGVLILHDAQRTDYHDVVNGLGKARFLQPWAQGQVCVLEKPGS